MPSVAQWSKLNEFLLQVGALDEQIPFCVNALNRLRNVVSFDQGRVYFFDEAGHVFDEYLLNVSKEVTKAYHEYYEDVDDARYSATRRARFEARRVTADGIDQGRKPESSLRLQRVHAVNWEDEPHDTRFFREYVARIGLTYSTGFTLYDCEHVPRALFCIDRTRPVEFSREELHMLSLAATHLDNMYRKLFATPPASTGDTIALMAGGAPLTERERQIATMLMGASLQRPSPSRCTLRERRSTSTFRTSTRNSVYPIRSSFSPSSRSLPLAERQRCHLLNRK